MVRGEEPLLTSTNAGTHAKVLIECFARAQEYNQLVPCPAVNV